MRNILPPGLIFLDDVFLYSLFYYIFGLELRPSTRYNGCVKHCDENVASNKNREGTKMVIEVSEVVSQPMSVNVRVIHPNWRQYLVH